MDKYTSGPWTKAERLNGPWWHISADASGLGPGQGRQAVAAVHGESKRGAAAYAEMFEANAQLIAAAPELLEALDALVDAVVNNAKGDHLEGYVRTAERAISKARGVRFNAK